MTAIKDADLALLKKLEGRRVTIAQLVSEGVCIEFSTDTEGLRARLTKLVDAGLAKKVKLKPERIGKSRQFGNSRPLFAFEAVGGVA
jgi:hypothetical protein